MLTGDGCQFSVIQRRIGRTASTGKRTFRDCNRSRLLSTLLSVVLVLLLTQSLWGARNADPDYAGLADDLIQRILKAVRQQTPADMVYREYRTSEYLHRNRKVLRTRQAIYQWRVRSGDRERQLVGLDGKEVRETFFSVASPSTFSDWDPHKWLELYDFKIVGTERVRDNAAIRIHFFPKKRQPRPNRRLEKVIMKLEGDLWLTLATRNLLKASVRLTRPARFGGGFLGVVKNLRIDYSQQPVEGQLVPESFRFELSMREFFRTTRFRENRWYADFAPLEKTAGTEALEAPR